MLIENAAYINRINPIQNTRETRNFGRGGCSISGGWPGSNEAFVSMSGCFLPVWEGRLSGFADVPLSAIHFLYTNTMPSLSIVKVLPSMVPMVIPAPCHFIVSFGPSRV